MCPTFRSRCWVAALIIWSSASATPVDAAPVNAGPATLAPVNAAAAGRSAARSPIGSAGPVAGLGFLLPLPPPPVILTAFRPPSVRWGSGHRGVDLAAAVGAVVRAAGPGVVVFAGGLAGRGVVSIEHPNGIRTTYEPVTATVRAGAAVSEGASIGTLQAGHQSCRPAACLHWGARVGADRYLDPMMLITGWRVRLKPWDD